MLYNTAVGCRCNSRLKKSSAAEYGKAIADYNEAIRLDPKDASAFYNRGHAWSDQEEYDRAIPDYSQYIRLDPHAAYRNRGEAWSAKGQLDRALADSKALEFNPQSATTYLARGNVWWAKCQYGRAFADYREAMRLGIRSLGPERGRGDAARNRVS